jgi:dUTP pyrophosphatase
MIDVESVTKRVTKPASKDVHSKKNTKSKAKTQTEAKTKTKSQAHDNSKTKSKVNFSSKVKSFAESAEIIFHMAKEKFDTKTNEAVSQRISDSQQILQTAEHLFKQFVDPLVADYLKRFVDFQAKVDVKLKTLPNFKGSIPQYESSGASGMDVRAQLDAPLTIKPSERVLVPTGLSMEVPKEYEIQARPRSGLSLKKGLTLVNTPGTIDADYRGEIKMIMINLGTQDVVIEDQERIAQLVICPVVKANFVLTEDLSDTARGESGFGSTGAK